MNTMTEALPDLALYPNQQILKTLDRRSFDSAISSWAALIQFYVSLKNRKYPDSLIAFIESYVRESAEGKTYDQKHEPSRSKGKGKEPPISHPELSLRSGIFILITEKKVIASPSPEFIWDLISLYGPTNVHKTVEYVKYVRKIAPTIIFKIGKLALHFLNRDNADNSSKILQIIGVLISDKELSNQLLTDDWYAELYSCDSESAMKVISLCINGVPPKAIDVTGDSSLFSSAADPADIAMLLEMFPDLNINTATSVLNSHSNVETASAYLLENPDIIQELADGYNADDSSDDEISRYQPLPNKATKTVKPSNPDTAALEATLRLIYEADEDERDDTYDDAPHDEGEAASTVALMKIEKQLWDIYNKTPEVFKRESRKSKQRGDIRRITNWTDEQIEGWARILEKNPRRRAYLEERFMFQGNLPHMRHAALKAVQVNDNGSTSASASGTEHSNFEDDTDLDHDSDGTPPPAQVHFSKRPQDQQPSAVNPTRSKQQTKNQRQRSDKYKSIQRQRQKDKHTKKMGLE